MNVNWVMPLSVAIEKIQLVKYNLGKDRSHCLNILRGALLANNSFDVDNLSDENKRAVSRIISSIGNEREDLPEFIFEGLRNHNNDWIISQIDAQKEN